MSSQIIFGTDGWRGVIAEDYTFDNVRRCTQGFADYLKSKYSPDQLKRGIVIGGDMRFHSENFAVAASEVLAGNEIPVHFCGGGIPTPVISYSVKSQNALGAINITASHNPPTDNGFKVRDENGGAIDPEGLKKIEALIPTDVAGVERIEFFSGVSSNIIKNFDPVPAYDEQLHRLIDFDTIKQAGFKVLVEPMWGNGAGWFTRLLAGGKTQVIEIHNARNPIFPEMRRPEPIHPNIDVALQKTIEINADVLLITDGDADRCGFADEHGNFIDQLRAFALLALYLLEVKGERGAIVKTLSTTSMLNTLGKMYNVPVYDTGVGFKFVAPKMMETNALIGGEESGGYAFRGHVPERDGILGGLYFLEFMCRTKKKPSELVNWLFSKVGEHHYDRLDTIIEQRQKEIILTILQTESPKQFAGLTIVHVDLTDGFKYTMEDGSWLLIRFSGTEPLVRIYSEAGSDELVKKLLEDGRKLVLGS